MRQGSNRFFMNLIAISSKGFQLSESYNFYFYSLAIKFMDFTSDLFKLKNKCKVWQKAECFACHYMSIYIQNNRLAGHA